ncbi:ADP-glyceromanno-heptose 6-epimerase [Flammeovirga yaeyamensis]|uniref:ADP-L-glycero-D-manno-heptose-6-epimerase n=1 Tax=Flammeovirga yaeyamensis TaxID=367791 RepID=A0AAX1N2K2_9BACT|nr:MULTISPECIES: ADP-glyceromanno-heptose 6-epimerase [Flammeovirga]ANQ48001.1 ADP-glyceromanno-heptose 6-epimerase [Flammeovirga sp. MY04]MBB3700836.1 ADP-L-glycero-D-manno-heptose 6-epimerase [Flammeovirga yaeyamensis]NMF37944.1 ADP-glyceromanno-heptose 6-epimerase [Flammeovirga yaeyamensis]QWG00596.1 ADP-glyceromanno-heptose 6-epimerase [Flammeovirga yaeyamensis]
MIVVTGAAGFIGSCMISRLNEDNFNHIIAVDDFSFPEKNKNLEGKKILERVEREEFFDWLDKNHLEVEFIFHLGARTSTAEFNRDILSHLNTEYTKKMWNATIQYAIPLVYASSAATYGLGELGYEDSEEIIPNLKPLNPYGESKNEFDKWALQQERQPMFWAGLKFFNVYGPNEYHKERMASVIFHAFNQIGKTDAMKLFQSHNPDYKDGEQQRDFVYVKDVVEMMMFLMHHRKAEDSGIYNVGTGEARTFLDLTKATFKAMGIEENISYIPTPEDIRDKYQYFTEATMQKMRSIGYDKPFTSLEEGVEDYVKNYLMDTKRY